MSIDPMRSVNVAPVPTPSVGEALRWSWRQMMKSPGPLIAGVAVWTLLTDGIQFGTHVTRFASDGSGQQFIAVNTGGFIGLAFAMLAPVVFAHVGLRAASGVPVQWRDLVTFPNLGAMIIAWILTLLGTLVGLVLLVIPALILIYLWYFTYLVGIEQNLSATEAMRQSWIILSSNVGALLPFALVGVLLHIVGALTLIGWVLTEPLVVLMAAYAYVTITGRQVQG